VSTAHPVPELDLEAAVAHLRRGGLLGFPTETVWGLAADARSPEAVEALRRWKGREATRALSVLVTGPAALAALGAELPERARRALGDLWPGPLTLVLPVRASFAPGVANEAGGVGFRCSPHPLAAGLARRAEQTAVGPVTATSLNRSGEPPARTRAEAFELARRLGDPALALLAGEPDAGGGEPSTVVDLGTSPPRVLRRGPLGDPALGPLLAAERAA